MKNSEIDKMQRELRDVLSKYGEMTKNSARYDDTTINFSLSIMVAGNDKPAEKSTLSTNHIQIGLAKPNTTVIWKDNPREKGVEITILKAARKNYTAKFPDGKRYKVPMTGCRAHAVETV